MKALVKHAPGVGNVDLMDVAEPVCGDDQVKIEVAFCGVCGTDLHVYHDTFPNYPPVILGHEFSGKVVEVGRNVRNTMHGDSVTVLPASAVICGSCIYCRSGNYMFCPQRRGMGHGVNGGFAPYAVVRKDQVYPLPDGLGLEECALCEPFAAAVQAVTELTPLRLGDVALLSGPGPIGLLCLKLLAAEGIKTIVAGAGDDLRRLETARRMGAAVVVDVATQDLQAVVREETAGIGVDVAFECAGVEASARNCLEALRRMGRYTQVGIFGREVRLDFDQIFFKQLQVNGSVGYSVRTWERLMKILSQRAVRLDDLITHRLPLAQWRQGFDICEQKQGIKVLLSPNQAN